LVVKGSGAIFPEGMDSTKPRTELKAKEVKLDWHYLEMTENIHILVLFTLGIIIKT
jgi:hypothetical protein